MIGPGTATSSFWTPGGNIKADLTAAELADNYWGDGYNFNNNGSFDKEYSFNTWNNLGFETTSWQFHSHFEFYFNFAANTVNPFENLKFQTWGGGSFQYGKNSLPGNALYQGSSQLTIANPAKFISNTATTAADNIYIGNVIVTTPGSMYYFWNWWD